MEQRDSLLNMVNRSQTPEEARGVIHAFDQMRRIGHKLENVSLHYNGNQGLDMIFSTQDGNVALVSRYAAVEAKHGMELDSLSKDSLGMVQASSDYNLDRLKKYLKSKDPVHKALAQKLKNLEKSGQLESYVALYGSKSLWRVISRGNKVKAERVQ